MADMELTVEDLYEGVKTELDDVTDAELSPTILYQKLLDSINYYGRSIGVRSNSLMLAKAPLSITKGIQDYILDSVQNFGRGLFVDIAPDTGDNRARVTIPIVNATVQSLVAAPFDSRGAFIFWKEADGSFKFRVHPTPQSSYRATLWYKPTRIDIRAFEDRPTLLEQFFSNVRKRAALTCVPYVRRDASWKKDIGSGLAMELQTLDTLFEKELDVGEETGGIKRPASYLFYNNDDGY